MLPPSRPTDHTLKAAARGDHQAWRQLVEFYSPRVYSLVIRQCNDADLAEEVTQATFVKVVAKLGDYQEQGKFESWMFRIAVNGLRDEMRRRKRQAQTTDFEPTEDRGAPTPVSPEASPATKAEEGESVEALRQAMALLPQADQELLNLRYASGLSFQEVADALGEPLGTVLSRGSRAIKKLQLILQQQDKKNEIKSPPGAL